MGFKRKFFFLSIAIGYSIALSFLSDRLFERWLRSNSKEHFIDYAHDLTLGFVRFLARDRWARHVILALDSALIDLCVVGMVCVWALYGVSKSLILSIAIFYSIRTLGMSLCQWPLPKHVVFENPGFPSLLVSYAMTNDLFFSGHTGIVTILSLEAWLYYRPRIFFAVAAATLLYTVFTLIVLHAHFLNDVVVALFAAVWVQQLAYRYRHAAAIRALRAYAGIFRTVKGKVVVVEDRQSFNARTHA